MTDIGQDNLKAMFITAARRLALLALLSGTKVLYRVGLQGQLDTGPGVFKLVPELAAQAGHTLYMLDTTAAWLTSAKKDGLTDLKSSVTQQGDQG